MAPSGNPAKVPLTGSVSSFPAERGIDATGTDVDPEEVSVAKQLYQENDCLHFQVEDATRLSFASEDFDLVVSQNVFHHVGRWEKVVQEIVRVAPAVASERPELRVRLGMRVEQTPKSGVLPAPMRGRLG